MPVPHGTGTQPVPSGTLFVTGTLLVPPFESRHFEPGLFVCRFRGFHLFVCAGRKINFAIEKFHDSQLFSQLFLNLSFFLIPFYCVLSSGCGVDSLNPPHSIFSFVSMLVFVYTKESPQG